MLKKVLVETEHSFRVLNLCIGNGETHMLNEREIFAILKKPGKIKMYELSEDGQQRVLITKDNYNVVTKFVNDNPVKIESKVEESTDKVPEYTEKVITPVVIHEPVEPVQVEEPVKAEEPTIEEASPVEETTVEEPVVTTTEKAEDEEEMSDEDRELAELEKELEKIEAEEKEAAEGK